MTFSIIITIAPCHSPDACSCRSHPDICTFKGVRRMKDEPFVICWKVDKNRKDKRTGAVKKIPQSDWLKYLWKKLERMR